MIEAAAHFDRDHLLDGLTHSGIDPEQAVIVGGAAMVLYGMKDYTHDVDALVHWREYDRLHRLPDWRFVDDDYTTLLLGATFQEVPFELAKEFPDVTKVTFNDVTAEAQEVSGFRLINPAHLLEWKATLARHRPGRANDLDDVVATAKWLQEQRLMAGDRA